MGHRLADGSSQAYWQTKQGEDIIDAEFSVVSDKALPNYYGDAWRRDFRALRQEETAPKHEPEAE